jgi:hypothetical protein
MALTPTVLTDAFILINAGNVSDHGNKVAVNATVADLDTTTYGQTWHARVGGLKDGTVDFDFLNDFVAANLDSIFWPLLGTVVTFEIRPTSAARAVGNPAYTGSLFVKEWKPIVGAVGALAMTTCSFATSGIVLRQTS